MIDTQLNALSFPSLLNRGNTMATTATPPKGKSGFVKEFLNDNPRSNPTAVNEAWTAAGMDGTISAGLINKMRSELGLSGNLKRGRKKKSEIATATATVTRKRGRKRGRVAAASVQTRSVAGRDRFLSQVDADLDRLLFKVMSLGDLPRVEECLRETRRRLYHSMGS
jgi:hypothetical protein